MWEAVSREEGVGLDSDQVPVSLQLMWISPCSAQWVNITGPGLSTQKKRMQESDAVLQQEEINASTHMVDCAH